MGAPSPAQHESVQTNKHEHGDYHEQDYGEDGGDDADGNDTIPRSSWW